MKNLYDEPNHRSSHTHVVPSLGGVAIFLSFSLSSLILSNGFMAKELKFIIASTIIMFALGIMDDIVNISPKKKLYGQIFAALIVIIMGDIRFSSFHGLFGIYELNYYVSILFTIFVMIVITNGFNLIDGIDGLASGISALCTLSFGIWFYITGHYDYAVLAASLFGALIAFFRFNVFSKKNKIFMGDTGSLILGLLLSILVIKFNEINILQDFKYAIPCAPIVSIAILAVPLFDTARVMIIRLKNGKSPFQPDKNHVHHRMLSLGYKHVQASLRIIIVNIIFIATGFCLSFIGQYSLLCVTILMGVFFSWLPSFLLSRKKPKQNIKIEPKQIFLEQKKETENIAEGINA
ncbi:MAG: undecaprenyl/decaprenyl-phosphate alpha-N-acetylglucosaminyl 1-phosphate transferase [Marinifilaceae bacterium]|nr:undecaprenyl/decaprenyl-phosphate alpha-N-acetylglucosaminyl 1-phosphate transferase [Marinifilaceae bacterium]